MRIDKIMFKNENGQLNFIDLFAGAGGLSEGFFQAGFNPIAHVEMNKSASKTLETRSAYYYLKKNNELDLYYQYERGQITRDELFSHIPDDVIKTVINAEMSPDTLPGIFEQIDTILKEDKVSDVDVIIGGPPCQAYSLVGRAQSSHMLTPMEEDPRNELYKMYTRCLIIKKRNCLIRILLLTMRLCRRFFREFREAVHLLKTCSVNYLRNVPAIIPDSARLLLVSRCRYMLKQNIVNIKNQQRRSAI